MRSPVLGEGVGDVDVQRLPLGWQICKTGMHSYLWGLEGICGG